VTVTLDVTVMPYPGWVFVTVGPGTVVVEPGLVYVYVYVLLEVSVFVTVLAGCVFVTVDAGRVTVDPFWV